MNTFTFPNEITLETIGEPGVELSEEDISLEEVIDFFGAASQYRFQ
ncbi:MAG: hypothetical protein AAGF98_03895 [Cyanobacteria bacterium P01_H01_bin.153]